MILLVLILIPLVAGLLAWPAGRLRPAAGAAVAMVGTAGQLLLACWLWRASALHGRWLAEFQVPWIPQIGASIHLAADGLSLLLVLLTAALGLVSAAVSWPTIRERAGLYYMQLLFVLAGVTGVFLAVDLLLFYFFWELMLVPMFFLIDLWGHERRHHAAVKFFLFTQVSGLFMLMAILGLYMLHGRAGGGYTFDYVALLGTPMTAATQTWLMLGFLAAFAVKLPVVLVHTWLPDAHTEAPIAGSIILAGLLLKTGAFGLLRFLLPLFPQAATQFVPAALALGVVGVLYGAVQAFGQHDLKRLVAYTSVSHMGFVLLGVFAGNALAMQGAMLELLCHGLSTGALFVVAGLLQERLGTRDMRQMGGFWAGAPRLGGAALFFALASLGLPGLGNFVAEFLILLGLFQGHVVAAVVATTGLVAATLYSLWMMQRVFFGQPSQPLPADLRRGEAAILAAMGLALVWLGLWPGAVLSTSQPTTAQVMQSMAAPAGGDATAPISAQDQARAPLRAEVRP